MLEPRISMLTPDAADQQGAIEFYLHGLVFSTNHHACPDWAIIKTNGTSLAPDQPSGYHAGHGARLAFPPRPRRR